MPNLIITLGPAGMYPQKRAKSITVKNTILKKEKTDISYSNSNFFSRRNLSIDGLPKVY